MKENYILFLIILILHYCYCFINKTNFNWISSSFGSSFATYRSLYFDINGDGKNDIIALSVDGEVNVIDIDDGKPIMIDNWPVYIRNEHFLSSPLIHIHGGSLHRLSLTIISVKGSIISLDKDGSVSSLLQLPKYFLSSQRILETTIHSEMFSLTKMNNDDFELSPEIYTDGLIMDLTEYGVVNDLLIGVNYISNTNNTRNIIIASMVIVNLQSSKVISIFPINMSLKSIENPDYLLNNFDIIDYDRKEIVVTLSSGSIYYLRYSYPDGTFHYINDYPIIYNTGYHKCTPIGICLVQTKNDLRRYSKCCIYSDVFNHLALFSLINPAKTLWEYDFHGNSTGIATETELLILPESEGSDIKSPLIVFGTNTGWIHCVQLYTGKSFEHFPIQLPNSRFSSRPSFIVESDNKNNIFILILSDDGVLFGVPVANPNSWYIFLDNHDLSSYNRPEIRDSVDGSINILFFTKSGLIWNYSIKEMKINSNELQLFNDGLFTERQIGTIYSQATTTSVQLSVKNALHKCLAVSNSYLIKVFINEYLYATTTCLITTLSTTTNCQFSFDLVSNYSTNIGNTYLFGTVQIRVSNSLCPTQITNQWFYIRNNYDFQFELIWLIWITFFICLTAILIFHLHVERMKQLDIPK